MLVKHPCARCGGSREGKGASLSLVCRGCSDPSLWLAVGRRDQKLSKAATIAGSRPSFPGGLTTSLGTWPRGIASFTSTARPSILWYRPLAMTHMALSLSANVMKHLWDAKRGQLTPHLYHLGTVCGDKWGSTMHAPNGGG